MSAGHFLFALQTPGDDPASHPLELEALVEIVVGADSRPLGDAQHSSRVRAARCRLSARSPFRLAVGVTLCGRLVRRAPLLSSFSLQLVDLSSTRFLAFSVHLARHGAISLVENVLPAVMPCMSQRRRGPVLLLRPYHDQPYF